MRRVRQATVAAVAAVVVAACSGRGGGAGGGGETGARLSVVASFYPLAELARRVGGDRVRVTNLTAAGTEPHDLELTPEQVDRIEDAELVVYLGRGFQPAVEEAIERSGTAALDLLEGRELAEVGDGPEDDEGGHRDGDGDDPHIWLDPAGWSEAVDDVRRALAEADAEGSRRYAANARAYQAALVRLDGDFRAGLTGCRRTTMVTSHAAFGYLARRYGLRQEAIAGLSPESEPDPRRLARLSDRVRADGTTTVFYETLVSPDVARTLARDAGVRTAVLDPIEGLSDEQVERGESYESVMRRNLAALREALGCP